MNAELKPFLDGIRTNIAAQQRALNELKLDDLPAEIRKGIEELKASLNTQLKQLEPLDQVPAANEAASALRWFVEAVSHMQEYASKMWENLQNVTSTLKATAKSYNELKARVDGGQLVEKAKLDEQVELAKQAGVDSCKAEIADLRRKAVANLPAPPDNVLALPTAEFNTAIADAQKNLATAKTKGLELAGRGAKFLKRALWTKENVFATEMAELEDAGLTPKPDPLLGEGAAPEAEAQPPNALSRLGQV